MNANVFFCILVCLASSLFLPSLNARTIIDGDLQTNQESQTLSPFSALSIPNDGSGDEVIIERDGLSQGSELATAPVDLVPIQWTPFSLRKPRSTHAPATASATLWRRQDPFANFLGDGRTTWDAIVAITPSVAAGYALTTLFTVLYSTVVDSWSRQPPRETIQFRYGALRVSFYRRDQVIPWVFVADLARKMHNAVEHGFQAFLEITVAFIREAAIVVMITAIGLLLYDLTDGRPTFQPRPPGGVGPLDYGIEE
ncbi:MAG: hypothetical protein Q9168_005022 [Polycauliona sp. 1 TL-2023]